MGNEGRAGEEGSGSLKGIGLEWRQGHGNVTEVSAGITTYSPVLTFYFYSKSSVSLCLLFVLLCTFSVVYFFSSVPFFLFPTIYTENTPAFVSSCLMERSV